MKEKDLRAPVEKWLEGRGYWVIHEILIGGYCDIVGVKFAKRKSRLIPDILDTVAIELKLNDVGGALYQAKTYSYYTNKAYIALPLKRCEKLRKSTIIRIMKNRIGVLAVGSRVYEMLEADTNPRYIETPKYDNWNRRFKNTLWRRTTRYRKKGG